MATSYRLLILFVSLALTAELLAVPVVGQAANLQFGTGGFTLTAGAGSVPIAGQAATLTATAIPSWAQVASGTWVQVPSSNKLIDLDPMADPAVNPNYANYPTSAPEWAANVLRQTKVIDAWCGWAYDPATDFAYWPIAGGHSDYAGNEPYSLELYRDAPLFRRLRNPTGAIGNVINTNDGQDRTGKYGDNRPRASHTYNTCVWVPGSGAAAFQGAVAWDGGSGYLGLIFVNMTTGEPALYGATTPGFTVTDMATAYDASRNAVWLARHSSTSLGRYSVTGDSWTILTLPFALSAPAVCYMPEHDCLLLCSTTLAQKYAVYDCATSTLYQPTFSGTPATAAFTSDRSCNPVWDGSKAYAWDNTTNTTAITRFTPPANPRTGTWTIDTMPVSGSNTVTPTVATANGTWNRFSYSPRLGGFVLLNATNQQPYFYKI